MRKGLERKCLYRVLEVKQSFSLQGKLSRQLHQSVYRLFQGLDSLLAHVLQFSKLLSTIHPQFPVSSIQLRQILGPFTMMLIEEETPRSSGSRISTCSFRMFQQSQIKPVLKLTYDPLCQITLFAFEKTLCFCNSKCNGTFQSQRPNASVNQIYSIQLSTQFFQIIIKNEKVLVLCEKGIFEIL